MCLLAIWDCKEIQPVHSEGDQPWDFFGRNDAKAETPVLWPPHAKSWLIGKDSDAGRDWGQDEKGMTEDEMAGWNHWLDGHEFGWTLGVGDRQGGLACCNSWGRKESDMSERLHFTRPSRTNTQKRCPFHYRGLKCKSRKSRNTWSNRQIWSWSTEWSRAKANRVLLTDHSKHPLPTTQEKTLYMNITRWPTPKSDCLYSLQPKMEKLYTVNKNKTRSWLWLRSWTPYCQIQT